MGVSVYRSGVGSRIAIGRTLATDINAAPAAPIMHVMPKVTFSVPTLDEFIASQELTDRVDPVAGDKGLQVFDGFNLTGPQNVDSLSVLLYFMFGSYSVSGVAAPYTHTFKTSSTQPPSLISEYWDSRMGAGVGERFFGITPNSLAVNFAKRSELISWSSGMRGTGHRLLNQTTEIDSTPSTHTTRRHLPAKLVKVTVDGGSETLITGLNLTVNVNTELLLALDGLPYANDTSVDAFTYQVSFTCWRDASDTIFGLDDDATHEVVILCPDPASATYFAKFTFPAAKLFSRANAFQIGGRGPQPATITVDPEYDSTAETSLKVDVANGLASVTTAVGTGA